MISTLCAHTRASVSFVHIWHILGLCLTVSVYDHHHVYVDKKYLFSVLTVKSIP